ncbi:hypothetical protein V5O48_006710 [Marasmius crinis-equi]|uniref:Uncharacterized protein n=1 Tax=Marasmius crinis-equi TaxID=585013 RepID=A0ABR3FJ03_9AGAR
MSSQRSINDEMIARLRVLRNAHQLPEPNSVCAPAAPNDGSFRWVNKGTLFHGGYGKPMLMSPNDHRFKNLGAVFFYRLGGDRGSSNVFKSHLPLEALRNDVELLTLLAKRASLTSTNNRSSRRSTDTSPSTPSPQQSKKISNSSSSSSSSSATSSPSGDAFRTACLEKMNEINATGEGGVIQFDEAHGFYTWVHPMTSKRKPATAAQMATYISDGSLEPPRCLLHPAKPLAFQESGRFAGGYTANFKCGRDCPIKSNGRRCKNEGESASRTEIGKAGVAAYNAATRLQPLDDDETIEAELPSNLVTAFMKKKDLGTIEITDDDSDSPPVLSLKRKSASSSSTRSRKRAVIHIDLDSDDQVEQKQASKDKGKGRAY